MAMLGLWYWSLGSISMDSVSAREVDAFYCAANLLAKIGNGPRRLGRRRRGSAMKAGSFVRRRIGGAISGLFLDRHFAAKAALPSAARLPRWSSRF